jgi:hypothetical protein
MRFDLIDRLFDLPAFVVEANERLDGRELGRKPRGDQPDRCTELAGVGIASRWYSITRAVITFPHRLLLFW